MFCRIKLQSSVDLSYYLAPCSQISTTMIHSVCIHFSIKLEFFTLCFRHLGWFSITRRSKLLSLLQTRLHQLTLLGSHTSHPFPAPDSVT